MLLIIVVISSCIYKIDCFTIMRIIVTSFQFSGLIAISIPLIYVILPETKGLSLETVQGYFEEQKTIFYK